MGRPVALDRGAGARKRRRVEGDRPIDGIPNARVQTAAASWGVFPLKISTQKYVKKPLRLKPIFTRATYKHAMQPEERFHGESDSTA